MKLKILIKYAVFSIFLTQVYASASIAVQVEHFIRRPVLYNFIQHMHREGRWQSWAPNIAPHKRSDVAMAPSTAHIHPTAPPQNFILPGFGLPLDSFFLHDSAGTERCEDAIRAESINTEGTPTTYLSIAYCLGAKEKTFILGADRASIVHIYKYIGRTLSCTYTALCPVRTEFGCWLNAYDGVHGREKELTLNNKVAQSPDFDRDHYSLDFVKEYSRQAAHIMMDTKLDSTPPATIHSAKTHHATTPHIAATEGYFYHYDIACHMANIAACPNGLSERLYRRGLAALLEKQTMTEQLSCTSSKISDGYTSAEESDTSISSAMCIVNSKNKKILSL